MKEREEFLVIGKDHPRVDVEDKARGEYQFVGDMSLPNMLHAKILRSPHAHAIVKKINTEKAEKLPGVKAVITYRDVPDRPILRVPGIHFTNRTRLQDSHILEKEVRYVGDRVAAVAAESLDIAEEALGLIEVEYQELPAVFDPIEAMQPGAPPVHTKVVLGNDEVAIKNNTFGETPMTLGDIDEGFKQADIVLENEYQTGHPHNAPLALPVCICKPLHNDGLEVWNATQGIHTTRWCLADSLGIPRSKIKVHRVAVGGAFGYYLYLHFNDPICAALALKTGLPVKLEGSLEEAFIEGGRHPTVIKLKTGIKKDGTFTAMDMQFIDSQGAYASGSSIVRLACGFFLSMYHCPNLRFKGFSVYTNTRPIGVMRGAGNPQQNFAVESQIDIIAEQLNVDPAELRLRNHLRIGDTFYGQGPDVISEVKSCGVPQLIGEGKKRIGWEKRKTSTPYKDQPWIKRGIGMAYGFHTSGGASEKPSSILLDYSGAIVKMNEDGTANLAISCADQGSGNVTSIAAVVAEELGIRYEDVIVIQTDTDMAPFDYGTHASRALYSTGNAARTAAKNAKGIILDWASRMLSVPADQLETRDGRVCMKAEPTKSMSIREVLENAQSEAWGGTAMSTASQRSPACPPHFTVTFVEVDVDTMTGEVKPVRAVHGADVGTPIIPSAVRGQLIGGLHMGMGYALTENLYNDPKDGHILNPNYIDYKMLTPLDMPETEVFFADTYEPTGPFGAKGVGEGATNPVAAAVYNAIYSATGVRIYTMPITPEKILQGLGNKENK
ncbi:MAG: carbon monoxide dehydrogenase [Dehalococcoidales bacterium]|nr:carbon monoxide dehydrogenase [Dehalococcoidales bacterium]